MPKANRLSGAEFEGPLFFRDFTRFSTLERLKNWDRSFQELIAMPNVSAEPTGQAGTASWRAVAESLGKLSVQTACSCQHAESS